MTEPAWAQSILQSRIDRISTQWSIVGDVAHFTLRYAPAIRRYIESIVGNSAEADDILQDFLLRIVRTGFVRASADRGRFRNYLKAALRNAVRSHVRDRRRRLDRAELVSDPHAPEVAEMVESPEAADEAWTVQWRECLLERTWQALEDFQREQPASHYYTVLTLAVKHQTESSAQLAIRLSHAVGRSISAEAFRKQLSRARRVFAELLVAEVIETLDQATPEDVEQELLDVGLMSYVRGHLPEEGVVALLPRDTPAEVARNTPRPQPSSRPNPPSQH